MTNPCEISWFSALCDDDYEFLGVPDAALQSSWGHCRDIVLAAETGGYDNILLPSGYQLGLDTAAFAGAIAALTQRIRLLMAVRVGETWPPQLARQIATLDQILGGRLTINIISSDMPGEKMDSEPRYRRTVEVMKILKTLLSGEHLDHRGEHYQFDLAPPRLSTVSKTCPPLYFGGLSPAARDAAAEGCDVYLMWPETVQGAADLIGDMTARAAKYGRTLKYGFRCHVIVRDTESEARAAAVRLLSKLDVATGTEIRNKSLDAQTYGVARQAELRALSDANEGYLEDNLWTGIGRARSGCGAAIVGDPDQVLAKINAYRAIGIEAFILSGYPHIAECFCTLPEAVRGSDSVITTDTGTLKRARRALQCAMAASGSSAVPGRSTMNALPTSPHFSSATPITALSATWSNSASAASTSAGYTFSPPEMYMSFLRSTR
jgi:alkanesulfonate monooxygenase